MTRIRLKKSKSLFGWREPRWQRQHLRILCASWEQFLHENFKRRRKNYDLEFSMAALISGETAVKPLTKSKKRVCFEDDDSLVEVFEIPYDDCYDSDPSPEELEPRSPGSLVDKLSSLSLGSISPRNRGDPLHQEKDEEKCQDDDQESRHNVKDVEDIESPEKTEKKKKRARQKAPSAVPQSRTNLPSVSQEAMGTKQLSSDSGVQNDKRTDKDLSQGTSKTEFPKRTQSREAHDRVQKAEQSRTVSKDKSRRERINSPKSPCSNMLKSGKKKLHHVNLSHKTSLGRSLKVNNSTSSSVLSSERKRPRVGATLPAVLSKSYTRERREKKDYPVPSKSITFPDDGILRSESSSWTKMSFISKDCSSQESKEPVSMVTGKFHSWKAANDIMKQVDIPTLSISPMWEDLAASKPPNVETNSVLSALWQTCCGIYFVFLVPKSIFLPWFHRWTLKWTI